jgi:hypothetical protein
MIFFTFFNFKKQLFADYHIFFNFLKKYELNGFFINKNYFNKYNNINFFYSGYNFIVYNFDKKKLDLIEGSSIKTNQYYQNLFILKHFYFKDKDDSYDVGNFLINYNLYMFNMIEIYKIYIYILLNLLVN